MSETDRLKAEGQIASLRHSNRTLAIGHKRQDATIEVLRLELAKHQESEFHPDWSMLEATRDSLKECQGISADLQAEAVTLRAVVAGLRGDLDEARAYYAEPNIAEKLAAVERERDALREYERDHVCGYIDSDEIDMLMPFDTWRNRTAPTGDGGGDEGAVKA